MRNTLILSAIILMAAACTEGPASIPVQQPEARQFFASLEGNPGTKTHVNGEGHLRWNAGDLISVFAASTANQEYRFDGQTGDEGGSFSLVSGSTAPGSALGANYALYPCSETAAASSGGAITTSLPSVQRYAGDSFGLNSNTMVAVTRNADDNFLSFRNACGYLVIKLYGDAAISSVRLEGGNGEKIAGPATVTAAYGGVPSVAMASDATESITLDCGDGVALGATAGTATSFWFVVPPATFPQGLRITATDTDGNAMVKSTSTAVTVSRNTVSPMAALEFRPTAISIPDPNFKAYCVANFDTDGDGEISKAEAEAVTRIEVSTDNIESLEGIGSFVNLEYLSACGSRGGGNSKGRLTSLDVSSNTSLTELYCYCNQLTSIDVSNNTSLTSLHCGFNQLTSLNVCNNASLTSLDCRVNQLTSLNVCNNASLTSLDCGGNQLTSLDVGSNTGLTILLCYNNQLTSLDVSSNTGLTILSCHNNQLTSLDVSSNTGLTTLYCESNRLTNLDVSSSTGLTILWCDNNQLTSLNVSSNTGLTTLYCESNRLTNLDVSSNTGLTSLICYGNQISSIYVWEGFDVTNYPLFCKDDSAQYVVK